MIVVRSARRMQALALGWRRRGRSVGLVPTMGALHEGHLSLFRRARRENDVVVASVFVNPAQFGPAEDWARYPRPWARDRRRAAAAGADVLFRPTPAGLYPPGFQTWVEVEGLAKPLCGPSRPGHFRGVATVVAKLFQLALPSRAYFGLKDYQQYLVVRRMARDLHFPVRVVPCPTVREPGGLARSSRNDYLSPPERARARVLRRALQAAGEVIKSSSVVSSTEILRAARALLRREPGLRVEYLSVADPETLRPLSRVRGRALVAAAVRIGRARLIDNVRVG
jgi:pantoate--beta-alanine ligase